MALRLLSWLEAGRVYDTNGRHDIPGRSRSLWAAWRIFLERRTEADFQAGAISRHGRAKSIFASAKASGWRLIGWAHP
jgi:hypothetical protein